MRGREVAWNCNKIALERRGWSQKDVPMNRELKLIAIDRENITWKQNHSSGGSNMVQSEPGCLAHGGCYDTPPPPLSRGTTTPSKYGAANCEADPGPLTSTRTVHPILDPHELMSCRLKHLVAIQAEMSEFARLVEARNHLFRKTELCRSPLETGQMLLQGQQRLDQVVQRRVQLAAEVNAQQLRLAEAGRVMESLDDRMAAALNAKFGKRSAALDKSVELLAVLTRVAEETLQPLAPPEKRGNAGPCDRGATAGSPCAQGSAIALVARREPKRNEGPSAAPVSGGGMHTLHVTSSDLADEGHFGRQAAGLTAPDLHIEQGARASRSGSQRKIGKRHSSDSTGDGPSVREQRKRKRNHLKEHERLYQADGSLSTKGASGTSHGTLGNRRLISATARSVTHANTHPVATDALRQPDRYYHGSIGIRARAGSHGRTCSIDRCGACWRQPRSVHRRLC